MGKPERPDMGREVSNTKHREANLLNKEKEHRGNRKGQVVGEKFKNKPTLYISREMKEEIQPGKQEQETTKRKKPLEDRSLGYYNYKNFFFFNSEET